MKRLNCKKEEEKEEPTLEPRIKKKVRTYNPTRITIRNFSPIRLDAPTNHTQGLTSKAKPKTKAPSILLSRTKPPKVTRD
jgi:hypothetical protein